MKELMFQNQPIRLVERDGKMWASAADIGKALGYKRVDSVTRIYDRHKAEFTSSMTMIVETSTLAVSGNLVTQARVFSLRGAHLIGMFARTAKAQEFRRWVLDVLESNQADASLIQQWYEAKSALDAQDEFASLCGKGLSQHRHKKPPMVQRLAAIAERIQPSLQFN